MSFGKVAETTPCLPFSLINDEGLMAFCESDFVVIPSGVLLRYISGKPLFLNDPTFPHDGITTCAHCSKFDCTIEGDWKKLITEMGGFHWMTCYGDYLKEVSYACSKAKIRFENISA